MEEDLVTHMARFAGALRERRIRVGLSDEVDGVSALTLVDLSDRGEVCLALRTALKIRRRDWEAFDQLFAQFWAGRPAAAHSQQLSLLRALSGPSGPPLRLGPATLGDPGPDAPDAEGELPGYSPEVLLRRKAFDQCTEGDLAAMGPLIERLALRLATTRSRRLVPTRGRGIADLRRSLRRAIGTGGELVVLARRQRAVELPRLVVLCDTSGSMDAHTRFLLAFVLALKRAARHTQVFAFNTSLTHLTPWLAPGKIGLTLKRLAAEVPDWSGGTRIGDSLNDFVEHYLDQMVSAKTSVIILSDGLDRGDPTLIAGAMRAIQRKAHSVIWLNPLLGDPRYEPKARGMAAALPFVDHFAPAHNLESLERLLPLLAA
jgi:uncharacterized protein with von Willebrand factor type A (vWA) domain